MNFYKISSEKPTDIEAGFDIEFVEPIIGAKLSTTEYFSKVLPFYNETGKLLSPSELGCALSHISIYKQIIARKEGGIIFEADIIPTKEELEIAKNLCLSTTADFIHLGWHPDIRYGRFFKGKKSSKLNMYKVETSKEFYGAFSYYISEKMALALIEYHKESIKLADSWSRFFMCFKITPYFQPIFMHPPARSEMHKERMAVSQNVHKLSRKNIFFLIIKLIRQKISPLKFWNKPIVPPEA